VQASFPRKVSHELRGQSSFSHSSKSTGAIVIALESFASILLFQTLREKIMFFFENEREDRYGMSFLLFLHSSYVPDEALTNLRRRV
jgi:hypothetical protein